jgi:hypothetical protein
MMRNICRFHMKFAAKKQITYVKKSVVPRGGVGSRSVSTKVSVAKSRRYRHVRSRMVLTSCATIVTGSLTSAGNRVRLSQSVRKKITITSKIRDDFAEVCNPSLLPWRRTMWIAAA